MLLGGYLINSIMSYLGGDDFDPDKEAALWTIVFFILITIIAIFEKMLNVV